jgi:hypothetical protein
MSVGDGTHRHVVNISDANGDASLASLMIVKIEEYAIRTDGVQPGISRQVAMINRLTEPRPSALRLQDRSVLVDDVLDRVL